MCRSAQSRDHFAGYEAPLALLNDVDRWVNEIHSYALIALANAVVHLSGGIAANFASPRIIIFRLVPVKDSPNPALAFQLRPETPEVVDEDDCRDLFADWDTLETACQVQAAMRADSGPTSTYVGSLPALFHVSDAHLVAYHPLPIYAPQSLGRGPLDDFTRGLLLDVVAMCIETMNVGIVLRKSADESQPEPDMGMLFLQKKKWAWVKRDNGWEGIRSPSSNASKRGLDLDAFWALLYQLCDGTRDVPGYSSKC